MIVKLLIGAEKSPKTISLPLGQTNKKISYKTEKAGTNVALIFFWTESKSKGNFTTLLWFIQPCLQEKVKTGIELSLI